MALIFMGMVVAVMPGYNVEDSLEFVLKETKKYVNKIIFVDDGSKDDSYNIAKKYADKVIKLKFNMGKGIALRTGIGVALEGKYSRIITLDSDGQHDPAYIPNFLEALEDVDMVIGSRYAGRFYTIPRNVLGNYGLNFITNLLSYGPQGLLRHKWLGDTQSGFRAFKAETLKKMSLTAKSYAIESEMIYEAAKNNLKIKEIPIRVPTRVKGVTIKDGINNALLVFKKRFKL